MFWGGYKMNFNEFLISFIVGIISGIISSLFITVIYRKIDQERDRQNYFLCVRTYFYQIFMYLYSEIDELHTFFLINEFPHPYKWTHLKKEEETLVSEVEKLSNKFRDIVIEYYREKAQAKVPGYTCNYSKYSKEIALIQTCFIQKYEGIMNLGKKEEQPSHDFPFSSFFVSHLY